MALKIYSKNIFINRLCAIKSQRTYTFILLRLTSTTPESKSAQTPNPKSISSDMVGPPDPVSNLRRIVFKQPPNETKLEKKFREMRAEVQEWNQSFWTAHNSRFFLVKCRYLFILHTRFIWKLQI